MNLGKCFVTGATGFIGQRLVSCLENSNHSICILTRNMTSSHEAIVCDYEKESIPDDALLSVDTVFHLAGYAHDLKVASKNEELYQSINIDFTAELAKLAIKSGVKRFVFVSSVKAGGFSANGRYANEDSQIEPDGIYGETKREAELQLLNIGLHSEMHISIIRSVLVYGPNVKGNLSSMITGISQGWFPPLPRKLNFRSLIHVDDLVCALLFVAKESRANGEIFIATDGRNYSSREIYETMCTILGKPVPNWEVPEFLFTIAALISKKMNYKVNKLLGSEYYSSKKLESIGFKAKKSLKEMNETSF
jgi:UDP-glucose 4-epimerase